MKKRKIAVDKSKDFGVLLTDLSEVFNWLDHEFLTAKVNQSMPEVFCKKSLEIFFYKIPTETAVLKSPFNNIVSLQVVRLVSLLEIDFETGVYLWMMGSFIEHLYRTPLADCLFQKQIAWFQPTYIIKGPFTTIFQRFSTRTPFILLMPAFFCKKSELFWQ